MKNQKLQVAVGTLLYIVSAVLYGTGFYLMETYHRQASWLWFSMEAFCALASAPLFITATFLRILPPKRV